MYDLKPRKNTLAIIAHYFDKVKYKKFIYVYIRKDKKLGAPLRATRSITRNINSAQAQCTIIPALH